MNTWTQFVKQWAAENGMSYMQAIKDPELSSAYKEQKSEAKKEAKTTRFQSLKDDAVALAAMLTPFPVKKPRGRPSIYENDEQRAEAKREKTLASTRKRRDEQKENVVLDITDADV